MDKKTLKKIFSRLPPLETTRLHFRRMHPDDCKDMFDYARRSCVTEYLLWNPHPDISYTYRYLKFLQSLYRKGEFYDWALIDKESRRMIGTCGFTRFDEANNSAEIGYVLNPDFWGKGLATEAVRRILAFGFSELGLNRIEAKYISGNERSRSVMENCGMRFEGMRRGNMLIKGNYRDIGVCAVLESDCRLRNTKIISLVGMTGCGKTSVGKLLAQKLNASFIDTDEEIVKAHESISGIFEKSGDDGFRRAEYDTLKKILTGNCGKLTVVSCGGGLVTYGPSAKLLCESSYVVWVQREPDEVCRNAEVMKRPPINNDIENYKRIYSKRREIYSSVSDYELYNFSPQTAVDKIYDYIKNILLQGD